MNVLAEGYGVYSIPTEGTPLMFLSVLTSGSKPVKFVSTNRLVPVTKTFIPLNILPTLPTL